MLQLGKDLQSPSELRVMLTRVLAQLLWCGASARRIDAVERGKRRVNGLRRTGRRPAGLDSTEVVPDPSLVNAPCQSRLARSHV